MPKCLKTIARYRYFQLSLKYLKKTCLTNCMIISKTINYTVKINMDLEETTPHNIQPSSSWTELYSTWTKAKFLSAFFIDLSKAFDTLDHNILINKLQYYGIKDTALDLFQSCLSNRRQYVQIGNNKSDTTAITTGVPQGSILGPQLFIICSYWRKHMPEQLRPVSEFPSLAKQIPYSQR